MSAKLEKALTFKQVFIRKIVSGEVTIHFFDKNIKDIVISHNGVVDILSKRGVTSDAIRKSNLDPLLEECKRRRIMNSYVSSVGKNGKNRNNIIYIAAHVDNLNILSGYKVHIEHGLKGEATSGGKYSVLYYKKHKYFPLIDLHITTGETGDKWTKKVLGPFRDKTAIGGYPKSDRLLECNTKENKIKYANTRF